MSYSMMKSSELRRSYANEKQLKYDWTVLTRPDVLFAAPFRIDEFLEFYNKYKVKAPDDAFYYLDASFARGNKINDPIFIGGCDVISFATPENMDLATAYHRISRC